MQYQTSYPYATTSQHYGASSHPREEQRRRQQEYSQALAQQVAQRDQQKQREREKDHQHGRNSFQSQPPFEQSRHEAFEPERGIFDGLGRNNQNPRTNFARGQPQLHHHLPGGPESASYPHASEFPPGMPHFEQPQQSFHQPPVDTQSFQSGFGNSASHHQPVPQQSWQQQPAHESSGPNVQTGWPSQQNSMSQARTSQFWPGQTIAEQAAPPGFGGYGSPQRAAQQQGYPQAELTHNGGRRQRTDIHDGSRGDSEEADRFRRKLQQQQEMQLALERQIEEKRQQKLEAKRRQEEEDRREMERFEEDKRRQRAEEERLQEEKRRKAEIEQQKAQQAAAAVAAANEQAKLQQQQKLHAQISQPQLQHPQHGQPLQHQHFPAQPQPQQPERFSNPPSPSNLKNPFTNSRAHLFQDPPPQRGPMAPDNHFGYSNQNASPMRAGPQGFGQVFPQENAAVGRLLDPTELRRQYDDMREELRRQKQLVDELRQAQVQIQQQQQQLSPAGTESGSIPTLMDLEKLRNELRGELDYREQIHRQEIDSLKREQQHERSPAHSPHRYPGVKNSLDLPIRAVSNNVEHVSPHPATTTTGFEIRQQRQSPVKAGRHSQSFERLPRLPEAPLDESLMSLHGESKFVYFDGRVSEPGAARNGVVSQATNGSKEEGASDALDEQSESVKVEAPKVQRSLGRSPTKQHGVKQSVSPSPTRKRVNLKDVGTDTVDDSHDFVVTDIPPSPPHKQQQHLISSPTCQPNRAAASSHRYSQIPSVLSSPSPRKKSGKWRLEAMGANDASDSDDDLDASLDGEQLEALFQRNVRRHEILLGFQTKVQAQVQDSNQQEGAGAPHAKLAWAELRQQLESNRLAPTRAQRRKLSTTSTDSNNSSLGHENNGEDEAALVASSQWMPSSLFLPTEHTRTRNK